MNRLSDYQTFLTQFLRNYETTGSVIPSGRALGSALCRHVGDGPARRRKFSRQGRAPAPSRAASSIGCGTTIDLWMVELNPTFAAHLRSAFNEKPSFRERREPLPSHRGIGCSSSGRWQRRAVRSRHLRAAAQQLLVRRRARHPAGVREAAEARRHSVVLPVHPDPPGEDVRQRRPERDRLKGVGEAIEGMLGEREFAREWVWVNVPPAWVHHIRF